MQLPEAIPAFQTLLTHIKSTILQSKTKDQNCLEATLTVAGSRCITLPMQSTSEAADFCFVFKSMLIYIIKNSLTLKTRKVSSLYIWLILITLTFMYLQKQYWHFCIQVSSNALQHIIILPGDRFCKLFIQKLYYTIIITLFWSYKLIYSLFALYVVACNC